MAANTDNVTNVISGSKTIQIVGTMDVVFNTDNMIRVGLIHMVPDVIEPKFTGSAKRNFDAQFSNKRGHKARKEYWR